MPDQRNSFVPLLTEYYQRIIQLSQAKNSPLLADGLDTFTQQPAQWTYPDGNQVVMSNFASQQNFIRGLVALTQVTDDKKYLDLAKQVTAYFLNNYTDQQSGLFHWGGHRFVNRDTGHIEGPASKECVHELKHHFPFYDFLMQIDPAATEKFLQGFWAAHVMDWQKLDLSRHGQYGKPFPTNIFKIHQPESVVDPSHWPSLPQTIGLTFVNASTDLIYAACHYAKFSGDKDALKWAKHLYKQFVLARHPETGMPVYQFSSPLQREPVPDDDRITFSWFGDRAKRQFGPEFGHIANEANALFRDCWPVVVDNPLAILACAKQLADSEFTQWCVDGIKAYFRYAWDEVKNEIIPMWNDAQDLTNYEFKRDGYYGDKGTVLKRHAADPAYLLTLVRASILSDDQELRLLTARMFARFGLGKLDDATLKPIRMTENTHIASPYLIFALLDLYQYTDDKMILTFADKVGQNLVEQHYHRGFFVDSVSHRYSRIDDPCAYALVAIEAAHKGIYHNIPVAISTGGYLHGERLIDGEIKTIYDRDVIYGEVVEM